MTPEAIPTRQQNHIIIPAFATAHSHAFQRALRGRTQRRQTAAASFWSWRGLMYDLAARLTPETIYAISHFAFVELAISGVAAVGEFHYVHHDVNGQPYANRTEMAATVIRAAREAGLRICLIRTAYLRGGYQQPATTAQKRFMDPDVDAVLADVAALQKQFAADSGVTIGLAAHSIRAVPLDQVVTLAEYARSHNLPFHMHIAEQRRELAEATAEYIRTPVALLAEAGVLDGNFVGIHATHLSEGEVRALGEAGASVCLCRTTERDLGDGLPRTTDLITAGVHLSLGVDSHAAADPFEEMRAVELDERSRTEARTVAAEAPELLRIATLGGYTAIGMGDLWQADRVHLSADDPAIADAAADLLADAVVFGATHRAVAEVWVGGAQIVSDGRHAKYVAALHAYRQALKQLGL